MDTLKDLSLNNMLLFLAFFVPGFVAIKVYDVFIAGERRDFSKNIFEVFAYSSLHYAVFFWLILILNEGDLSSAHPLLYWASMVILIAVLPVGWPLLFFSISRLRPMQKFVRDPLATPWDRVFDRFQQRNRPVGVILHVKGGSRVGGVYASESRASSYPEPNQIYLERVYPLTDDGRFGPAPINKTLGILVNGSDISAIEFFEGK